MPTTFNVTTTYAGEAAKLYIASTLLASKTVDNVTQHLNVPYRLAIPHIGTNMTFVNAGCEWDPDSTITLLENILEPKRIDLQVEICKEDLWNWWESASMGASLTNQSLPPLFGNALLDRLSGEVTQKLEQTIWSGDANNTGEFDGFLAQFNAIDVNGTTITAGNVIAELQKVVNAIPNAVKAYRTEDLVIYVPTSVIFFYAQAQATLGAFEAYNERFAEPAFLGIKLVECPGMPDDTMVAARKSNMHFGTSIMSDFTNVLLLDQELVTGQKIVNFSMTFSGDTTVGVEGDAVYYANPNS